MKWKLDAINGWQDVIPCDKARLVVKDSKTLEYTEQQLSHVDIAVWCELNESVIKRLHAKFYHMAHSMAYVSNAIRVFLISVAWRVHLKYRCIRLTNNLIRSGNGKMFDTITDLVMYSLLWILFWWWIMQMWYATVYAHRETNGIKFKKRYCLSQHEEEVYSLYVSDYNSYICDPFKSNWQ